MKSSEKPRAISQVCGKKCTPSFPCKRVRVKELSELAGEFDLGKALGSRLMVPMSDVKLIQKLQTTPHHIQDIKIDPKGEGKLDVEDG